MRQPSTRLHAHVAVALPLLHSGRVGWDDIVATLALVLGILLLARASESLARRRDRSDG